MVGGWRIAWRISYSAGAQSVVLEERAAGLWNTLSRTAKVVLTKQGGDSRWVPQNVALRMVIQRKRPNFRRNRRILLCWPSSDWGRTARVIFATNRLSAIGVKQTSAVARDDRGEKSMPKMTDSRRKKIQARQRRSRAELQRKKKAGKRAQRSAKA